MPLTQTVSLAHPFVHLLDMLQSCLQTYCEVKNNASCGFVTSLITAGTMSMDQSSTSQVKEASKCSKSFSSQSSVPRDKVHYGDNMDSSSSSALLTLWVSGWRPSGLRHPEDHGGVTD